MFLAVLKSCNWALQRKLEDALKEPEEWDIALFLSVRFWELWFSETVLFKDAFVTSIVYRFCRSSHTKMRTETSNLSVPPLVNNSLQLGDFILTHRGQLLKMLIALLGLMFFVLSKSLLLLLWLMLLKGKTIK